MILNPIFSLLLRIFNIGILNGLSIKINYSFNRNKIKTFICIKIEKNM